MLHTWDQKLLYHVHLHCVIAGGALAPGGRRWLPARGNYLFPVRELSQVFRRHYVQGVRRAFAQGKLSLPGRLAALAAPAAWAAFLAPLATKDWVVYSQPPWGGPTQVLQYLSRYTHRVALSNGRLRAVADGRVTFTYRDRRDHNRPKELTLSAAEFIRRFLQHVTPPGLCRMRHYGFLSNRVKEQQLPRCRALLGQAQEPDPALPSAALELLLHRTGHDVTRCPQCGQGTMMPGERLLPQPSAAGQSRPPSAADSS